MILNTSLIPDLALGIDSRQLVEGDSQVDLPSKISPIIPFIQPIALLFPDGSDGVPTSFVASSILSRTNQVAATTNIGQLLRGMWRVNWVISSWFNYVGAAGTADELSISLRYGGAPTQVIWSRFAVINGFTDVFRHDLLLREDTNIDINFPLTGVAESLNIRMCLQANRIL